MKEANNWFGKLTDNEILILKMEAKTPMMAIDDAWLKYKGRFYGEINLIIKYQCYSKSDIEWEI